MRRARGAASGAVGCVISLLLSSAAWAESKYSPTRDEWLQVAVSAYVNSFKEFDTTVEVDGRVSVVITYDSESQSRERAQQLARKFERDIPALIKDYPWARRYPFAVRVQGADVRADEPEEP